MFAERNIVIVLIVLLVVICFSSIQAGTHFIEVPKYITDDMFFGRSEDVKSQLRDLINKELIGSDEIIATIIFTRNGEPILPPAPEIDKIIESGDKSPKYTGPPDTCNITFDFVNYPDIWDSAQINDMDNFLYDVLSDDGQAQGIYNCAKKLYGSPFFGGHDSFDDEYVVELHIDGDLEIPAYWIPPMAWYQQNTVWLVTSGELYLKWYPNDPYIHNATYDDARGIMAKAMMMLFWGAYFTYFDQFMDGLSYAGGTVIMNHYAETFSYFNDLFHGQQHEERQGFILYDNYNQPAIAVGGTGGYNFGDYDLCNKLSNRRYECAEMAWYKVFRESNNGNYFRNFNENLYIYGRSFIPYDAYSQGFLYIQPKFDYLEKIAEVAWISGNPTGPEGYDNFNDWRKNNYILTIPSVAIPQMGVFANLDKLLICMYYPRYSGDEYFERPPFLPIPVHVMIYDAFGQNIYHDDIHYIGGGMVPKHYIEIDMPQILEMKTIYCNVSIVGDEFRDDFDEPDMIVEMISGISQNIYDLPQIIGLVPPDYYYNRISGIKNDSNINRLSTEWTIIDPNNGVHILDINGNSFILNLSGEPDGLDGVYKLCANGELFRKFTKDKESFFINGNWSPYEYYYNYDENGNGVKDEYEQELAEEFAPILLFQKDNWTRPIPTEVYLDNGVLYYRNGFYWVEFEREENEMGKELWTTYFERAKNFGSDNSWFDSSISDWAFRLPVNGSDPDDWKEYWDANNGFINNYPNTIYYHFFFDNIHPTIYDPLYIQYWFFYPFNDWLNNHEGDWENVVIRVSEQDPSFAESLALNYHYHKNIKYVDLNTCDGKFWDELWLPSNSNHFKVYVGGDGDVTQFKKEDSLYVYSSSNHISGSSYPRHHDFYYNYGLGIWLDTRWFIHCYFPIFGDVYEEVESPYRVYYPICLNSELLPYDPDYDFKGPYYLIQLNSNIDCKTEDGEILSGDPPWLTYPGKWGLYTDWVSDCPRDPIYNDFNNWSCHDVESTSNNMTTMIKKPVEMKKIDEMKNNPFDIYNPFSLDSSGGYSPNCGLSSIENTTFDISIYPNPCSTSAVISIPERLNNNNNEPISINIYDISGRLVRKEITTSSFTWDLTSIDGKIVSNGIYLVNISTTKENKTLKLLVAR
jgi:hypothetical protein